LLEQDKLDRLVKIAQETGVDKNKVLWTGSAKTKEEIIMKQGNEPKPVDYCRITGLPDEE